MIDRNNTPTEKAFLVGTIHHEITETIVTEHLDELEQLAVTAGAEVIGRFVQKRDRINPRYFIGKGKAEEIINQAKALGVQLIIFDDELSPSQVRNYLKLVNNIKVIDRTGLILDVFRQHARTQEAKTQVELAQLQYLLPRLTRMWTHLERQMGGIGTRAGAGETQIEVDRRLIRDHIAGLRRDLKKIEKQREVQGKQRRDEFRVAIVGYTNTGKSTLMNALTGADIPVQDQLFATLDTTIRVLNLDNNHKILLSDSVGFIRKLPHTLVASFRSTLKEVLEADILLIVLEADSLVIDEQLQTVREVLMSIGAEDKEPILVMNKIDIIEDSPVLQSLKSRYPEAVFISALNHLRLDKLLERVVEIMDRSYRTATVSFDPSRWKEISSIYDQVEVLDSVYDADRVSLTIRGHHAQVSRIRALSENGSKYEN